MALHWRVRSCESMNNVNLCKWTLQTTHLTSVSCSSHNLHPSVEPGSQKIQNKTGSCACLQFPSLHLETAMNTKRYHIQTLCIRFPRLQGPGPIGLASTLMPPSTAVAKLVPMLTFYRFLKSHITPTLWPFHCCSQSHNKMTKAKLCRWTLQSLEYVLPAQEI